MTDEKTKEEKPKERWIATEVPATTKLAVVDTEKKEAYNIETTLARILNDLEQLKKLL